MSDVLKELLSDDDSSAILAPPAPFPMYVLSNRTKLNGSACILYQDLLKNFAERLRSDLYILPSSIHEVLIIPVNSFTSPADPLLSSANSPADTRQQSYRELSEMVQEVNATQLSTEDILSDHVYYYSRESSRITM